MQIPVFKKAVDTNNIIADSPVLKPLPLLAAVYINNSRFGVLLYRFSYGVFALSLLLVFYPFIVAQPLWLLGLLACSYGMWRAYRRNITGCVVGSLSFSGGHWWLAQDGCTCQLDLAGEVLCWPWLISLPLREMAGGKFRRIIIFGDSLNKGDSARLRRWLRACLTPKA